MEADPQSKTRSQRMAGDTDRVIKEKAGENCSTTMVRLTLCLIRARLACFAFAASRRHTVVGRLAMKLLFPYPKLGSGGAEGGGAEQGMNEHELS